MPVSPEQLERPCDPKLAKAGSIPSRAELERTGLPVEAVFPLASTEQPGISYNNPTTSAFQGLFQ